MLSTINTIHKNLIHFLIINLVRILILTSVIFLYACSGENEEVNSEANEVGFLTIKGKVFTFQDRQQAISTQVFLDLNQNLLLDENEVVVNASNSTGEFQLQVSNDTLSTMQLKTIYLVAKQSFSNEETYFASPLAAYVFPLASGNFNSSPAVISPLSSLVVAEILVNQESLHQAHESINAIAENADVLHLNNDQNQAVLESVIEQLSPYWQGMLKQNQSITVLQNFFNNSKIAKFNLTEKTFNPHQVLQLADKSIQQNPSNTQQSESSEKAFVIVYKSKPNNFYSTKNTTQSDASENLSTQQLQNTAEKLMAPYNGQIAETFSNAVQGFTAKVPNQNINQFLKETQNNPAVESVVEDIPISMNSHSIQTPVNWGLDRIDQTSLPLNNIYQYQQDGTGVNAYVMDTGIRASHSEFTKRVLPGFTAIADGKGTQDCMGHGSHVAGIIGGSTYGVAKNIRITPVRVLDCRGGGSLSSLLAGLDWIVKNGKLPAVINMSIGTSASDVLDQAVNNAVKAGFVVVTSAGNNAGDSCTQSPARSHDVINVGSSDSTDTKSYYSNYGQCVDLFAPGSAIRSAWFNSDFESQELSGTSMSAPYVAGVVALYLQINPLASPLQVRYALYNSAIQNQLIGFIGSNSPNRLLSIATQLNYTAVPKPIYVAPEKIYYRVVYIANVQHTKIMVSPNAWQTTVTIKIKSINTGGSLQKAKIMGSFSIGGKNLTCTTDLAGVCSMTSGLISKNKTSTLFTISSITGQSLVYLNRSNKVNSVSIVKPTK